MKLSSEKNLILIGFMFLQGIKTFYAFTYTQEKMSIMAVRVVALLVYAVLSYLSYRNNKVATIILAIIIAISGLGALTVGVLASDQLLFAITSMIIGVVFIIWGVRLFILQKKSRLMDETK